MSAWIDEMGYLPLDQVATSFLSQLVSQRYTKGPILDRRLHRWTTVNSRDESYRLKDKRRAGVFTIPSAKGRK